MKGSIGVVTGGTRGIGLVIAKRLLQRAFSLAITYKDDTESAERALRYLESRKPGEQHIILLRGDAGDPDSVAEHHRTIRAELGTVSVLVNNAGIMPAKSLEEISVQEWDETIRINLSGAFYWCREVVPGMKEIIELPRSLIEERFNLTGDQGGHGVCWSVHPGAARRRFYLYEQGKPFGRGRGGTRRPTRGRGYSIDAA